MTTMEIKACLFFLKTTVFFSFLFILQGDAFRQSGMCHWTVYKGSNCSIRSGFLCSDGQCIDRGLHCNERQDCQDNSDELYCNYRDCPKGQRHCSGYRNCILEEWLCDGVQDCPDGQDEDFCGEKRNRELTALNKGHRWLRKLHRKSGSTTEIWGSSVARAAVALYLAGNQTRNGSREFITDLAYETSIHLLSLLSKKKLQDIPSTDLASYVNALLVTCLDPRRFHGQNIVQELRSRVERQNYTNPYVLLALCNAGDTITETDKTKLVSTFWAKHKPFWTDIQAGVLMALACAGRRSGSEAGATTLRELALELKQRQYRNGTVENFRSTALVLQALMAAEKDSDPDHFDGRRALEQLLAAQGEDGSFGSFMNAYYALPVLNCRSLADLRTDHCDPVSGDVTSEISVLQDSSSRSGSQVRVLYSLWIGDEKDLERDMVLRVPANTSLYGVMERAAELDSRFRFEYTVKDGKPYVNALSGLQDDPERGKFWFQYKMGEGKPTPSQESPADVKTIENDHFVMWYRSGPWIK